MIRQNVHKLSEEKQTDKQIDKQTNRQTNIIAKL